MQWIQKVYAVNPWLGDAVLVAVAFLLSLALRSAALIVIEKWLHRRAYLPKGFNLRRHYHASLLALLFAGSMHLALPFIQLSDKKLEVLSRVLNILLIVAINWFSVRSLKLAQLILYNIFDITRADNMRQRRMRTQIQFIYRVTLVFVCITGVSFVLMNFESVRRLGTSLIASAGVASVVIGFAAQRSLANFIAGFQIAFTQPIRLDDVLIVEGEWGRVEEINLSYVVINLWDLRRLVLPITYFVEKPFQNWTRTSANLLAYSYVYVDYRAPLEPLRKEFQRVCEESPLWDHQVCILQVTDLTESTMQLRALTSARNASDAFDLRCVVREKLVEFLQKNHPEALPIRRLELKETHKDNDSPSSSR